MSNVVFEQKVVSLNNLASWRACLPEKWVLTNGVFDILHRGHVTYLARARALGMALVIGVNTDASVKLLGKGDDRPLNVCADRMAILAALDVVTFVLSFDENTAESLVRVLQPPIYVKGGDYQVEQTPEGRAVAQYGGVCHAIAFEFERSTTRLLQKIRGA